MKAQHDQNLDIFRDFFPNLQKFFFFRTGQSNCLSVYSRSIWQGPRSVHGITVCLMYFNLWPAAGIIMAHSDTWFSS